MRHTMFVALLVVALLPVVEGRDCNFPCTNISQPVCGTDGNTYSNRCELSRVNCKLPYKQRISVEYKGRCQEPTTAPGIRNQTATPRRGCPLGCPRDFNPVCGCDGRTYSNACILRTTNCVRTPEQQVTIVSNGTCDTTTTPTHTAAVPDPTPEECSLACPKIYAPVCGSDGRTYGNGCELRVRNCLASDYDQVKIVSDGPCGSTTTTAPTYPPVVPDPTPGECSLVCPAIYAPVCGSDGRTYGNGCELGVRNCLASDYDQVKIVSDGPCGSTTTTAPTYPPTEPSTTPEQCTLQCPLNLDPVCGSDGITYSNPCVLRADNCVKSPYEQVVLVSYGECKQTTSTTRSTYRATVPVYRPAECPLGCTDQYDPVCGSDGSTYGNACELRASNCIASPNNQIQIVRNGTCYTSPTSPTLPTSPTPTSPTSPAKLYETTEPPLVCPLGCPRNYDPVCGSDGRTYGNPCVLRAENCVKSPFEQVVIVSNRECPATKNTSFSPVYTPTGAGQTSGNCSLFCKKIGDPVCGSDGETYGNPCELRAKNCVSSPFQQVQIVARGTCESLTTTYPSTEPIVTPEPCPLGCNFNLDPVCGSDGITYPNPCVLRSENCLLSAYQQITIVSNGSCSTTASRLIYTETAPREQPVCTLACTDEDNPVCGSDLTTYFNPCELRVRNCRGQPYDQITIIFNGSCVIIQSLISVPEATTPPVPPPEECPLVCTRELAPVCGSDGRTYGNACGLRTSNCDRSAYDQVVLVSNGTCYNSPAYTALPNPRPEECSLACLDIFDPVCGSDGTTYGNACYLKVRNCLGSAYDQVRIVSNGTCESSTTAYTDTTTTPSVPPPEECPLDCTLELAPVCGSDGRTYGNACGLRTSNCVRSAYDQVVLVSNGTCYNSPAYTAAPDPRPVKCSLKCQDIFDPVCGSDGTTYGNACSLRVRNCLGSAYDQVRIVSNGTCQSSTTAYTDTTTEEPRPCPDCRDNFEPICGSDGVTYINRCYLLSINCLRPLNDQIQIAKEGPCETTTTPTPEPAPYPYK